MDETRSGKYGSTTAIVVEYIISTLPEEIRKSYRRKFIKEFKKYKPKRELDGITPFNPKNPEHLAKWAKEGCHLMYQNLTSERARLSLLDSLQ